MPKVQAPFIPGQKEAVDLMNDEERRSGDGDGEAKKEEDEKLYGDYYTPKQTEVVGNGSNEQTDLYSPESAATLVVNHEKPAPKPSRMFLPLKFSFLSLLKILLRNELTSATIFDTEIVNQCMQIIISTERFSSLSTG